MPLTLLGQRNPLASSSEQLKVLADSGTRLPFEAQLDRAGLYPLCATGITIFQINLGKLCNQTCRHCHVDAGPDRIEIMSRETAGQCITALAKTDIPTIDITGGAPELNPNFRWLVEQARALGRHVIDRCNLSVLLLPSQANLAEFLATHRVEIVASLPSYRADQTDSQRGNGIFEKSIEALRLLNRFGYGRPDSGLILDLVYNPVGAFLPPKQEAIEAQFKKQLRAQYGIEFNKLYTITNMPVSRFLEFLIESGNYDQYMTAARQCVQSSRRRRCDGVAIFYRLAGTGDCTIATSTRCSTFRSTMARRHISETSNRLNFIIAGSSHATIVMVARPAPARRVVERSHKEWSAPNISRGIYGYIS